MTKVTSEDIFIQLANFPTTTKEAITPNEDGSYTIFINARLSNEEQLKSYKHALKHIQNGDFDKTDVQKIEYSAHQERSERIKPIPAEKYLRELTRLKQQRKLIQEQIKKEEERLRFLQEHCDLFQAAEYQKLYGNDL